MLSPYAAVAMFLILLLVTRYKTIADAFDEERRKVRWDHARYGGTVREVLAWWWHR